MTPAIGGVNVCVCVCQMCENECMNYVSVCVCMITSGQVRRRGVNRRRGEEVDVSLTVGYACVRTVHHIAQQDSTCVCVCERERERERMCERKRERREWERE